MNQETIKKYNLDLYDKTEISGKYDIPKIIALNICLMTYLVLIMLQILLIKV